MRAVDQVLVFGEDEHDTSAIIVLVRGLRPSFRGQTKFLPLRKPLTLVKDIDAAKLAARGRKVAATTRAADVVRTVRACVFHEDTDAVEPSSAAFAARIRNTYAGCVGIVVPAVPAWEMEAWWYLFPDAVAATHPTWRRLDRYAGRDTGKIVSPKEKLRRDVRPPGRGPSASTYEEKHSEMIARAIVDGGHLHHPSGTSVSWTAFVAAVKTI